jgi:predicted DNA-binding transcriptional regulator AlpA
MSTVTNDIDILIDAKEVSRLTSLHRTSFSKLEREGDFPQAIRLTRWRKAWRRSQILAWIDQRERKPLAPLKFGRKQKEAR